MRAELARRYAAQKPKRLQRYSNAAVYCEVVAIVLKAWWQLYGN
jgi:hypothetical protein